MNTPELNDLIEQDYNFFFSLVKSMREEQRRYFKTRDLHCLSQSKLLELKVDKFIEARTSKQMPLWGK